MASWGSKAQGKSDFEMNNICLICRVFLSSNISVYQKESRIVYR